MEEMNNGTNPNPEKKGLSGKTIGIIAAAVVVIAAALVFAMGGGKKDPKDIIVNALTQVTSSKEESAFSKTFGTKELSTSTEPAESNVELTLDSVNSMLGMPDSLNGSTITSSAAVDTKTGNMLMSVGAQIAGVDFGQIDAYMDEKEIMVGASKYIDQIITLNYEEDLKKQIEANPYLKEAANLTDEDYALINQYFDAMRTALKGETTGDSTSNIVSDFKSAMQTKKDFKDMLENVTELSEETFTYNGAEIKASGYEATIKKETLVTLLEDAKNYINTDEEFKAEMQKVSPTFYEEETLAAFNESMEIIISSISNSKNDLVLKVYVDKDGNLISLNMTKDLESEGSFTDMAFEWNFKGGETMFENMDGSFNVKDETEDVTIKFTKTGNTAADKFDTSFTVEALEKETTLFTAGYTGDYINESGAYNFNIDVDVPSEGATVKVVTTGTVADLVAGKAATINIDSLNVNVMGMDMVTLKGSFDYKPLETQVKALEGTKLDAMAATKADWTKLEKQMTKAFEAVVAELAGKLY